MSSTPPIAADPAEVLKQARALLATDPAGAVDRAHRMLEANRRDPAALRLLAAGLRQIGKIAEAEQAEGEAIASSSQNPRHREAARASAGGDTRRATAILESLLAFDETDVIALLILGRQLSAQGKFDAAEALLRKAIGFAPADASLRIALAEHFLRSRRAALAIVELDDLGPESGSSMHAMSLRAEVLESLGRHDDEVEILQQLLAVNPGSENYRVRLGHALRSLGRTDEAVEAYRQVLSDHPFEGITWSSLANLKTVRFSDDDIATMEQGLVAPEAPSANRLRLNFALGKAHEDRGEYERSFGHYAEGNRLRAATSKHDPRMIATWVDRWIDLFTADFLSARTGQGSPARDPIFIIGMPRSGSTLIEQILASHPAVEGTAELTDLANVMRDIGATAESRQLTLTDHIRQLTGDELQASGDAYIERTRIHRVEDRPFFTDKMPNNWIYTGIIRLILPNAKIVDVRRHPLDCCFSNWKQLYAKGLEQSYSMDTMARYYADYVRLMRHFDAVQPGAVHRVIYERVVEDLEGEVRRLLDYLELPFDEACLAFHTNARAVRTISSEQVRQPINRGGLDQWKPFDPWLGPMKDALGDTLEQWRD